MKPRLVLLFVLICSSFWCYSQTYPVRTITTVSVPYPVSLAQFADDEGGKVNLTVIPSDSKMQDYPVKLRLFISGNGFKIYSDPNSVSKTVTLNFGETQMLSGAELKAWFNPDNLIFEGYSKSQYLKSGQLPEGLVQVWFEAWDYYRNFNISGTTRSMMWLFQNNPPTLNFPADKKEFPYADPQNITFNWSAGQSPFSVAGATNEYKFELWEIWPDNLNPDEVALSSRPLYSTTQSSTTLVYGTDCPILLTGRRYAWRVTAFDPEGKKQYKNNGYSAVRSFRFGRDCGIPDFKLEKVTASKALFSWNNENRYTGYTLRYRNAGRRTANWYEKTGSATGATISGLSPATKYEVQLQGTCYEQEGGYSASLDVQTPQELTYTCGATSQDTTAANDEPLSVLLHNDYFKASDFDVQVEQATGENGVFSGIGYVRVPLLNFVKFNAHFSNISINSLYRMTKGSVVFDYNEANGLMADVSSVLLKLGISSGGGQNTFSDILPS
ncbi:MAG: fibronectin type III domain-containing protein, partial [Bacteroidota bacterium]|nr:fibronectin type III domain-containing protein [Bacteroidota bacterium]